MKRALLCLALVALMVTPVLAGGPGGHHPPPGNVGIDVQGYVDGTASYNAGVVKQESCEVGLKKVTDVNCYGETTNFDCVATVPSPRTMCTRPPVNRCGVEVDQSKWDVGVTVTNTCSVFSEKVDATYAVGAADMNSLGGVAICASPGPVTGSAVVTNTHNIAQSANFANPCGSASAGYTGTQSLNLQANRY